MISFLLLVCLLSAANAELLGCNATNCPTPDNSASTACIPYQDGIGITSFNSNITDDGPLTWTIGVSTQDVEHGKDRFWKNFLLGTPPTIDITETTDFAACTFLFSNITTALQVPPQFNDFAHFSCDTVLGGGCARDLVQQAADKLQAQLGNSSTTEMTPGQKCAAVRDTLQGRLPDSCKLPSGVSSWGDISVQRIDGGNPFNEVRSVSQANCTLTSGGPSYNLHEIDLAFIEAKSNDPEARAWRNGTTPLMTIFFNDNGTRAEFLPEPEIHLSCLNTVPSLRQDNTATSNASPRFSSAEVARVLAWALAIAITQMVLFSCWA